MKKEQRQIYIEVTGLVDWSICAFCKYHVSNGSPCYDPESDCESKIDYVLENIFPNMGGKGCDCWAFKPNLPLPDIIDIVGIILAKNFDTDKVFYMVGFEDKKDIKVYGLEYGKEFIGALE